jgi:hypothetical protein
MSIETLAVNCDICGKKKESTNHWWGARYIACVDTITYRPWQEWGSHEEMTHHLCGQGCCLTLHERYLEGKLKDLAS